MGNSNTTIDMAVKPETVTFGLVGTQTPDGTDAQGAPKFKTELKAVSRDKDIQTAKEKGELLFEQTFSFDRAGTLAGIPQVIKDEEEAINIFNAGLKVKLNSRVKAMLEELDENGNPTFQPVEGNYDLADVLNEPAQRRNLSPTEKAIRVLVGLGMTREQATALVSTAQSTVSQGQGQEAAA